MKIQLTNRDKAIIEFLKNNKCADTESLSNIFFKGSVRATQNRLKKLCDNGYIKYFRPSIIEKNIYYYKHKHSSYKHAIKVTQFISELYKLNIEILKIKTPFKVGNMIADSLIICKINEDIKILFVEVELQKYFNLSKYEELYYSRAWKGVLPVFPNIVVITDKRVDINNKFNIIKIDTEFNNIEEFILKL